jgi:hypothetical protein
VAFESEYADWFNDTISIAPQTGLNDFGEDAYGPVVNYSALVVGKTRMARNLQGEDIVSMVQCYLSAVLSLTTRDKLTLPSAFMPNTPPIISIMQQTDEAGRHHLVIFA